MTIQYNKKDVENAIINDLKQQGMNLDGKVVTTERVKDLIHVRIEEKDIFADMDKPEANILDDE